MPECSIIVVFDNNTLREDLIPGWGFACVVRFQQKTILFDTGGDGAVLLNNMKKLNVDPHDIEAVVLSHAHFDHTDGLGLFLEANPKVMVYLPQSFPASFKHRVLNTGAAVEDIDESRELFPGVFTTGEMKGAVPEEALVLVTSRGDVVITGCAHPGIVNIVQRAKSLTGNTIHLVIGGFHFPKPDVVTKFKELGVERVAPCHCTGDEGMAMFSKTYGTNYIEIGVGKGVDIE